MAVFKVNSERYASINRRVHLDRLIEHMKGYWVRGEVLPEHQDLGHVSSHVEVIRSKMHKRTMTTYTVTIELYEDHS